MWRTGRGRMAALLAAAAVAFAASGCGGDDDSGGGASSAGGLTPLKVTTISLCTEVPIYWADRKGIFEEHGIDIEFVPVQGGGAALAALQGGSVDIAYTNPFSAIMAIRQGIDLAWIATHSYSGTDPETEWSQAIAVKEDSPLQRPADLEGHTVAVNELGGVSEVTLAEMIRVDGGDPEKVEFVALPYPQIAGAVENGTVDAGSLAAPMYVGASGLRTLGDAYIGAGNGVSYPSSGYVVKSSELDGDRLEVFKEFHAAMAEANAAVLAPENLDEQHQLASEICDTDVSLLESIPERPYEATTSMKGMNRIMEIMVNGGMIDKPLDPATFVPDWSRKD